VSAVRGLQDSGVAYQRSWTIGHQHTVQRDQRVKCSDTPARS
jgi:hypothetical protein